MSPEERQARLLSQWLDGALEEADETHIDADVVEAISVLRPDLAPAPRVSADDILGMLDSGPLAQTPVADADLGTEPPTSEPDHTLEDDNEPAGEVVQLRPRKWWGLGGGAAALLAAGVALGIALNSGQTLFSTSGSDQVAAISEPVMAEEPMLVGETDAAQPSVSPEPTRRSADITYEGTESDNQVAAVVTPEAEVEPSPDPAPPRPMEPAATTAGDVYAQTGETASAEGLGIVRSPTTEIQTKLNETRPAVAGCYDAAARRDPAVSGAIEITWGVIDGRTGFAEVSRDSTGDDQLGDCIIGQIQRIRWPAGSEGEWRERWGFSPAPTDVNLRLMEAMDADEMAE